MMIATWLSKAQRGTLLAGLLGALSAGSGAAPGWSNGFERPDLLSAGWDATHEVATVAGGGWRGSDAVTGAAQEEYGGMWRRIDAGESVELTARLRASSEGEPGAVAVALSPIAVNTAGYPQVGAVDNQIGVRLTRRSGAQGDYATLQLHYGHPFCGQVLPNFRSAWVDLDTWYEVRVQVWPSDQGTYLARAWYRPAGAEDWAAFDCKWPGRRHVVAYEGFRPAFLAVGVSPGGLVDEVNIQPAAPPAPLSLPQAKPVSDHRFTVLSLAWSSPDTKYLHDHVAEMEQIPLDGMAVQVGHPRLPQGSVYSNGPRDNLGWKVFSRQRLYDPRFTRDLIDPAIADLQATPFHRFRSNYIFLASHFTEPHLMDWFDDDWWANLAANAELLATVAQEGGSEGILFDTEQYGNAVWGWPKLSEDPLYADRTYEETRRKVRQRGAEFVRSINAAYPGVRILLLHAWDTVMRRDPHTRVELFTRDTLHENDYGLLAAFLDGMLEGSDEHTILIDGCETTYWVDALPDFVAKAHIVREEGIGLSEVPELFRQKVRVGFAIYLDRDWPGQPWDPADPRRNHWSPERLALVVGNALAAGDGLVWIYSEMATWLLNAEDQRLDSALPQPAGVKFVPQSYWQALDMARRRAEELRQAR